MADGKVVEISIDEGISLIVSGAIKALEILIPELQKFADDPVRTKQDMVGASKMALEKIKLLGL